jgi:hypothetical protein
MVANADTSQGRHRLLGNNLLIRPRREPDEWGAAYPVRVAVANGLLRPSPSVLKEIKDCLEGNVLLTETRSDQTSVDPKTDAAELVYGHTVPRWALVKRRVELGGIRVCWQCLELHGYIRSLWLMRDVELCPEHGEPLCIPRLDSGVGASIWSVLANKNSLWAKQPASHAAIHVQEVEWSRKLWGQMVLPGRELSASEIALPLASSALCRAVVAARRGRDCALRGSRHAEQTLLWLDAHGLDFRMDEAGLSEFLSALPNTVHRAAAYRMINCILQHEAVNKTVMSTLPLQAWQMLVSEGAGPVYGKGAGGGLPDSARDKGVVLISTFARAQKVSRTKVRSAMADLEVEPVDVVGRKRKFALISRADAERLQAFVETHLTPLETYKRLNVADKGVVRQLRLSSQITYVRLGSKSLYLNEGVEALLSSLQRVATPAAVSSDRLMSLDAEGLYFRMRREAVHELFMDIRNARFPVHYVANATGLKRFAVPTHAITRLLRRTMDFSSRLRRDPRQLSLPYVDTASQAQ